MTKRKLNPTPHGKSHFIHGHSANGHISPTYGSWADMWKRCTNPKSKSFPIYGGRGITICDRWKKFENFLADMGERASDKTLDRRNNEGNYEPSNCHWATRSEQAKNRRMTPARLDHLRNIAPKGANSPRRLSQTGKKLSKLHRQKIAEGVRRFFEQRRKAEVT